MLFSLENARDNIRNREGKRVFYLGKGDQLSVAARDFLNRERIEILSADKARPDRYRLQSGGYLEEKPEHMTHLQGDVLVCKTHPRIAFRGAMDALEAELLLCGAALPDLREDLQSVLDLARKILQCEVLDKPLAEEKLCGLTQEELRAHSHRPQDFYGQPHFMPSMTDTEAVLRLNKVRTSARNAELKAVAAFVQEDGKVLREDILRGLNRMSSMLYILMIKQKADK